MNHIEHLKKLINQHAHEGINRKLIHKKIAKALLIKFLMAYQALDNYVMCYNYYWGTTYSTAEVLDKTIDTTFKRNAWLREVFQKIPISFDWHLCEEIVDKLHLSIDGKTYALSSMYWREIHSKWNIICGDVMIEAD